MNYRIIEVPVQGQTIDVLLRASSDEKGDTTVVVETVVDDCSYEEVVTFGEANKASRRFIVDYSTISAAKLIARAIDYHGLSSDFTPGAHD